MNEDKSDVAIKINGEDLDVLTKVGEDIIRAVQTLPGTDNYFLEQTIGQPYLNIEIDRDAVARYGLNVDDVQLVVEVGIVRNIVSEYY